LIPCEPSVDIAQIAIGYGVVVLTTSGQVFLFDDPERSREVAPRTLKFIGRSSKSKHSCSELPNIGVALLDRSLQTPNNNTGDASLIIDDVQSASSSTVHSSVGNTGSGEQNPFFSQTSGHRRRPLNTGQSDLASFLNAPTSGSSKIDDDNDDDLLFLGSSSANLTSPAQTNTGSTDTCPFIKQIFAGGKQIVCIASNGDVWEATWKTESRGQVIKAKRASWAGHRLLGQIESISLGLDHHALIAKGGKLYTWGSNGYGALGVSSARDKRDPTRVKFPSKSKFKATKVVVSGCHTVCLMDDGSVWSWGGDGVQPVLGHGSALRQTQKPKRVEFFEGMTVVDISCSSTHTVFLSAKGIVYCCGPPSLLGTGTTAVEAKRQKIPYSWLPQQLGRIQEEISYIQCGDNHTIAVAKQGTVYSWGSKNSFYQLCRGTSESNQLEHCIPFPVDQLHGPNLVKVQSARNITVAVVTHRYRTIENNNHQEWWSDGERCERFSTHWPLPPTNHSSTFSSCSPSSSQQNAPLIGYVGSRQHTMGLLSDEQKQNADSCCSIYLPPPDQFIPPQGRRKILHRPIIMPYDPDSPDFATESKQAFFEQVQQPLSDEEQPFHTPHHYQYAQELTLWYERTERQPESIKDRPQQSQTFFISESKGSSEDVGSIRSIFSSIVK